MPRAPGASTLNRAKPSEPTEHCQELCSGPVRSVLRLPPRAGRRVGQSATRCSALLGGELVAPSTTDYRGRAQAPLGSQRQPACGVLPSVSAVVNYAGFADPRSAEGRANANGVAALHRRGARLRKPWPWLTRQPCSLRYVLPRVLYGYSCLASSRRRFHYAGIQLGSRCLISRRYVWTVFL